MIQAPEGTPAIETERLMRTFGHIVAVRSISLRVSKGEIFGVLGPNGAGKSTTIRMLCGILSPSGGRGTVLGFDIVREAEAIKQHIGYMTQRFSLYEDLTVDENLSFYGGIYGFASKERRRRREVAIERAGIGDRRRQLAGTLSGGWKQRVALACATLHDPQLLFLDEPTAGVDPVSRRAFWVMIHQIASEGTTIVLTTHYMDEAERCHRIALILQGTVFALGTPAEILERSRLVIVEADLDEEAGRAAEILRRDSRIGDVAPFGGTLRVASTAEEPGSLVRGILSAEGIHPRALRQSRTSMEDAFVWLVRKEPGSEDRERGSPS